MKATSCSRLAMGNRLFYVPSIPRNDPRSLERCKNAEFGWAGITKDNLTERPEIKVLLMSGYTERPVENIPVLAKPFVAGVLTRRMRELLAPAASDPA